MGHERKREELHADESELELLQAYFEDPGARMDAERQFSQISPRARLVLVAHYFEGLSLEEVSAVTGTPLGTTKSRLASGLKQLRTMMDTTN